MKEQNWKNLLESVGMFAIVVSLVLVALELRQNTVVSTANALSGLSGALDPSYDPHYGRGRST